MFKKSFLPVNFYPRRLLSLKQSTTSDRKKHEKKLMEPFEYIKKVPCKFHELTAPVFNYWLKVPEEKLNRIQQAMKTVEAWTVLLDDIQDKSSHRYGVLSAHHIFGPDLTINAANKALLLAQEQIADLGHPSGPKIYLKKHEENFYGQGVDLYWTNNFIIPSEDEHIEMTRNKTGTWFALPVELLQLFSTNKTDYSELGYYIGIYYHLVDDYVNLFEPHKLCRLAKTEQENHTINSDIEESKITLAVIHASQFPDVATELADIFKQRTSDPELQNRAISLLKKHGSDKYVREALKTIEAEMRTEIDRLGGNPLLHEFIDDLSLY